MPRLTSIFRLPSKLRRRARRSRMMTLALLSSIICLVILPLYFIYKPPSFLIHQLQRHWPDVLWEISTKSKIVALTIDDGPSEYTQDILEILKANNAHATFFVIGSHIEGREKQITSLVAAGNELGNHAMRDEPSRSLTDEVLTQQIATVQRKIEDAYIKAGIPEPPPHYFRPGSGFYSTRMRDLMRKLKYKLVLGNIYPHDPQIKLWKVNSAHILSMLKPGGIIICHDRRRWTIPMLEEVLPEIRRRGYQIVTVSELLEHERLEKDAGLSP